MLRDTGFQRPKNFLLLGGGELAKLPQETVKSRRLETWRATAHGTGMYLTR